MEAKYKFTGGQQGAVGDEASATNFTQVWQANAQRIDLLALASELEDLRGKLTPLAHEPSHFSALSEVAKIEKAARAGNGPVTLEHLKTVDRWFWDSVTTAGPGVAAAKHALGL